jgi:formate dehydrogenase major subunit
VADVAAAEVVFVIGANPTVNHPVAATWIKNAVKRGTKLVVADPRRGDLARHATRYLQFRPSTDVALLDAMLHVIVHEGLADAEFLARRTEGFEALAARVADYPPERVAPITGIDADTIREVARLYAGARASMILWGMGVSQHVHGTDNARCLIALAMVSGQIGRPGTGLHPLRGQNNVQGASDAGLIPMMLPDYRRVSAADVRPWFEAMWASPLDPRPGLTVVEIMHAIDAGGVRGMYIVGENPAMSDPDLAHARAALARLEHLVVQDIFLTETAVLADVVLPAGAHAEKVGTYTNTDRLVQLGRAALDPPGDARQDLWAIEQIGRRMGLPWRYWPDAPAAPADAPSAPVAAADPRAARPGWRADADAVGRVYEEMRATMPSITGITWKRLQRDGSAVYPCADEDAPGQPVVFADRFPDAHGPRHPGAGRLDPRRRAARRPVALRADHRAPARALAHRHDDPRGGGARRDRTGRHGDAAPGRCARDGRGPRRRGASGVAPRRDRLRRAVSDSVSRGNVFLPFAYREAAANLLTNAALDPVAKIPEFKFCACGCTRPGRPSGWRRRRTDRGRRRGRRRPVGQRRSVALQPAAVRAYAIRLPSGADRVAIGTPSVPTDSASGATAMPAASGSSSHVPSARRQANRATSGRSMVPLP